LGRQHRLRVAEAQLKHSQGDLDGALDLLCEAEHLYQRSPLPVVRPIPAMKARIWVAQGKLTDAMNWVRERGLSIDDDLSYVQEFEHVTLARILIACYKSDHDDSIHKAIGLLDRLLQAADEGGRTGSVIEILVLQSLAHSAKGDILPALAVLERAIILAEPEGYVRVFVDEGPCMAELLTTMNASGKNLPSGTEPYAQKLLAAFEKKSSSKSIHRLFDENTADLAVPPSRGLIDPLSQRELEVLGLIGQGLSNQEIGERLFLALDTIKGHNRRIFDKLDVKRRTEALARARELGLL
jgi:LuxR family maltose regulon positive regulatory protein